MLTKCIYRSAAGRKYFIFCWETTQKKSKTIIVLIFVRYSVKIWWQDYIFIFFFILNQIYINAKGGNRASWNKRKYLYTIYSKARCELSRWEDILRHHKIDTLEGSQRQLDAFARTIHKRFPYFFPENKRVFEIFDQYKYIFINIIYM